MSLNTGTERPLSTLRFYLQGEGKVVHALYELLFNNALAVELRPGAAAPASSAVTLGREALQPVGFGDGEELLPTPDRLFRGYRVLQEYFAFPEKFLFVDLVGGISSGEAALLQGLRTNYSGLDEATAEYLRKTYLQ